MMCLNNAARKGSALYVALMATTILLGIALSLASLSFGQMGMMRALGDSVLAFFAADAGVERALLIDSKECALDDQRALCVQERVRSLGTVVLNSGASYQISVEQGGEGACARERFYCAQAFGAYKDARRAVRITR